MANVYTQTKRLDYITLTFTTSAGVKVVKFSNMEVNRDVESFEQWWPEIFTSAGGIATKLGRRQPRRFRFQVRTDQPDTICKLNTVVSMTPLPYKLRFCMNGFWDCTAQVQALPASGVPAGGVVVSGVLVAGVSTLGSASGSGLLSGGQIVGVQSGVGTPTVRGPVVGDLLQINGQVLVATAELLEAFVRRGVMMLPMCMEAVVKYDPEFMFKGQGRGLGVNAGSYHVLEVLESATLPIPLSSGILVDPGQLGGQGNSGGSGGNTTPI